MFFVLTKSVLQSGFFVVTIKKIKIEFDINKSQKNDKERGLPFHIVSKFEWDSAIFWQDDRKDYGEERFISIGYIGNRLYVVAFTLRFDSIRVISLRKANKREIERYAKA